MNTRIGNFLKTLGPGILFASTAIGVSHLVQSTRAGAEYGFELIALVLLTNLCKYPFFEYGSRYANATGTSLIDGYLKIGKWMLWLYLAITIGSMFFVGAAVGAVTSGFMVNLFGIDNYLENAAIFTTIILFIICLGVLAIGKFNALDKLIKIIGCTLLITTLFAFTLALIEGPSTPVSTFKKPDIWTEAGIGFMIALMGWMPTAVDLSTWNSLWTVARINESGYQPTLKETLLDFNIGYIFSAILSICFITMGAYLLYGTGKTMPNGSAAFANEVVNLYTATMGNWSYPIIAASAFSIMFGTSIAVFDGYARSLEQTTQLILHQKTKRDGKRNFYILSLIVVMLGAFLIIWKFGNSLKQLVDLATTISFLIAPIIAMVNFRLVSAKYVGENSTPPVWLKLLSWIGIIFLTGFSMFYINTNFSAWVNSLF